MQKFQHLRINRLYIGMFYLEQSTYLLGAYRKQYVRKDNKILYKISLLFNGNPKTSEKSYKITGQDTHAQGRGSSVH